MVIPIIQFIEIDGRLLLHESSSSCLSLHLILHDSQQTHVRYLHISGMDMKHRKWVCYSSDKLLPPPLPPYPPTYTNRPEELINAHQWMKYTHEDRNEIWLDMPLLLLLTVLLGTCEVTITTHVKLHVNLDTQKQ